MEDYKKSIIFEAVTKGLDKNVEMKDSGVKWIGEIPKDWEIGKIGNFYKERKTIVTSVDYKPLSVTKNGILPQIEGVAKSSKIGDRKKVLKDDFVINSRSDRKESSGVSPLSGSVSLINIVLEPTGISSSYTKYLLKNSMFAEEFYRWGNGIVDDLWSTRYGKMKKISIPLPSKETQESIATFLDKKTSEIDTLISDKKEQLQVLDEYKKSMIYEYVTGKKEVK